MFLNFNLTLSRLTKINNFISHHIKHQHYSLDLKTNLKNKQTNVFCIDGNERYHKDKGNVFLVKGSNSNISEIHPTPIFKLYFIAVYARYTEMFSTPKLSHLTLKEYEKVYEPAEDSFLLLDALEKDFKFITDSQPRICLEIGSGSGIGIVFLAQLLGQNVLYLATDINAIATQTTLKTARENGVYLEAVQTDLVYGLLPRISKRVDVLLFNPPYVVTPSEEIKFSQLDPLPVSWAGGKRGREVIDRLLPQVKDILSETGIFYLVVIQENDPEEIIQSMEQLGFETSTILTRRSGPELLSVLRFKNK